MSVLKTKIKLMILFGLIATLSVFFAFSTAYAKVKVDVNNGPYLEYYAPSTLASATAFKALLPSGVTSIVFDTYYVNPRWENGSFVTDYTDEYETLTGENKTIFDNGGIIVFTNGTDVSVVSKSKIYAPADCSNMFSELTSLKTITFNNFDTSATTKMSGMFYGCSNMEVLNISNFTSHVDGVNTTEMFEDCKKLTSITMPTSTFKTTNMYQMFYNCQELTALNLTTLNTSKVTNMEQCFYGCYKIQSLNVSKFNTLNVKNMSGMFHGCKGLEKLDLSSFNTSKVENMKEMFRNCSGIKYFNTLLYPGTKIKISSNFITSKVTDMSYMFYGCSSFVKVVLDQFKLDKTNTSYMFYGCTSLETLTMPDEELISINAASMFSGCTKLKSLNLGKFRTITAGIRVSSMLSGCTSLTTLTMPDEELISTNADSMFSGCAKLKSLNLGKFRTITAGLSVSSMLSGCTSLTSLTMPSVKLKVTDVSSMFQDCSGLTSLDVSKLDTSSVTSTNNIFNGCSALTSLNLTGFQTANVTTMTSMFNRCTSLTKLDLSSFNTANVTYMDSMFYGCAALRKVVVNETKWSTAAVTNGGEMFTNCTSIEGGAGTTLSTLDKTYARVDHGTAGKGYFHASYVTLLEGVSFNTNILKVDDTTRPNKIIFKEYEYYSDITRTFSTNQTLDAKGYTINTGGVSANSYEESGNWIIEISSVYPITTGEDCSNWFNSFTKLVSVEGWSCLDCYPTKVNHMFYNCISITSTDNLDLVNLYLGSVTDMKYMFSGCTSLENVNFSNVESFFWNSYSLTDAAFTYMFYRCNNLKTVNFSGLDLSGITNLKSLLGDNTSSTTINLNLSNCQLFGVEDLEGEFKNCTSLQKINLKDASLVEDGGEKTISMNEMFYGCTNLVEANLVNITFDWAGKYYDYQYIRNVKITDTSSMFYDCTSLTKACLLDDIPDGYEYFSNNTALMSNVTDMSSMFSNCSRLTELDIKDFNTSNVTDMSGMFNNCSSLAQLVFGKYWNGNKLQSAAYMFSGCMSLNELHLYDFQPSYSANIEYMFWAIGNNTVIYTKNTWYLSSEQQNSEVFRPYDEDGGGGYSSFGLSFENSAVAYLEANGKFWNSASDEAKKAARKEVVKGLYANNYLNTCYDEHD